MKSNQILLTAAALALSAWPLCAQENAPEPSQQGPPPREEGPRNPDSRPQDRERRFQPEGGPMRRPWLRGENRDRRADGPPPQQARPDGDSRREGPPPPQQGDRQERRQGPQAEPRGGEQGPRFGPQDKQPEMNMRPPQMEQRDGPGADNRDDSRMAQRSEGMRRHQRRMMDNYGFAPRRGNDPDFRRGENEMRAPMPPPPGGPQFDHSGPDRGPVPGWDRGPQANGPREMMRPRPEFAPEDRGNQGPRFYSPRPHHDGPPPPRDDDRRPDFR